MLGPATRNATFAVSVLFVALGTVLFVLPPWAADHFPWRVSSFLAMTMGGWYIGTGFFAWSAARDWRWSRVHPLLAYLWLFSLGQASLLVIHADVIDGGAALTWPYAVVVGAAAIASAVSIVDAARRRPARAREAIPMPAWARAVVLLFVVAVALLALPLVDGYDSPRSIWPGELTLISARAFAVFFGALSLSALSVALARSLAPMLVYVRAGVVLSAAILVAAGVYIGRFDFGDHPGQLLYVGLYVFVLASSLAILAYGRARARDAGAAAAR